MMVSSFQISDSLQLAAITPEDAEKACQEASARLWVDLQDAEPGELEAWLDKLEIGDLTRRLCFEARDRPGFYPLRQELLLVIPVLSDTDGSREPDYVAFLCRENLLLTLHRKTLFGPRELAALDSSEAWLPERTIAGLVSALMIELSLRCLGRTTELRRSILALEERMDRDPNEVEVDEILDRRSDVLALGAMVSDQLPALQAFSATDKVFFKFGEARDYMNCALVNLQATDRALDWLDGRIGDLRAGFQMHAQDKTNRRLNMLTILSAIFMPITLLAGIWGMNFEAMPELSLPYSYPSALGLMALVGLGMYLFFRRTGWFD